MYLVLSGYVEEQKIKKLIRKSVVSETIDIKKQGIKLRNEINEYLNEEVILSGYGIALRNYLRHFKVLFGAALINLFCAVLLGFIKLTITF